MKQLIIAFVVVLFFVLIWIGAFDNIVGMVALDAKITYKCVDNDNIASNPLNVKGVVTVTSSAGGRWIYTDYCASGDKVMEFTCDPETHRQSFSDHPCTHLERVCKNGRCVRN